MVTGMTRKFSAAIREISDQALLEAAIQGQKVNGPSGQKMPMATQNTSQISGTPTIRMGSQGLAVAYCQNLLNARIPDTPVLWVDGAFGSKTDQQVRKFQMMKGLVVDGIVGPMTWGALQAGPPVITRG